MLDGLLDGIVDWVWMQQLGNVHGGIDEEEVEERFLLRLGFMHRGFVVLAVTGSCKFVFGVLEEL